MKYPLGSKVVVVFEDTDPGKHMTATVVGHGRDKDGAFVEVEWPDGREERLHGSYIVGLAEEFN